MNSDDIAVIKAADALESYMHENAGTNDDWPISIQARGEDSKNHFVGLLQNLRNALQPYRKTKQPER